MDVVDSTCGSLLVMGFLTRGFEMRAGWMDIVVTSVADRGRRTRFDVFAVRSSPERLRLMGLFDAIVSL